MIWPVPALVFIKVILQMSGLPGEMAHLNLKLCFKHKERNLKSRNFGTLLEMHPKELKGYRHKAFESLVLISWTVA